MELATLSKRNVTASNNSLGLHNTLSTTSSSIAISREREFSSTDITLIFTHCVIFVLGTPGNIYVIHKFAFTSKRGYVGAKFVVALAIADFLASFILPTSGIYQTISQVMNNGIPAWHLGTFLCCLLQNLSAIFLGVSSWCLVAIAHARMRFDLAFSRCFYINPIPGWGWGVGGL